MTSSHCDYVHEKHTFHHDLKDATKHTNKCVVCTVSAGDRSDLNLASLDPKRLYGARTGLVRTEGLHVKTFHL